MKEQGTPGLTAPRPGSEMTGNNPAFAFSTGFATDSHESLQIFQHSLAPAAPRREAREPCQSKKLQINRQTSYFLVCPSLMVIKQMSAIFSIRFNLVSIIVLPEMGVHRAQLALRS